MKCFIEIERTLKDKNKRRKRIDIASSSRSIDLDDFLGDDDEYRISDAGILKHFAQVNEHELIDDLLELFNSVRSNPYGHYFIYDNLLKRPDLLKPEERNRVSPVCVAGRYSTNSCGFFKDKSEFGRSAFGHFLPNPRGGLAKAAFIECIDLGKLTAKAVDAGVYGLAEFKGGTCTTHSIPDEVLSFIMEWKTCGEGRRFYQTQNPLWSPDFVYTWATGFKGEFYF